ncbi:MAG: cell division protein FtsZ [Candidatus Sumerlaeota bacterium]|nr:cell division protein FtsZ [Candidatus Sumerlaeota bacterium]
MSAFEIEPEKSPHTRIKVIGVGGGGTNAVDYMLCADIQNVEFCVVNTDARVLERSKCASRIQIGEELTRGLGAGGNPELGAQCAEASAEKIAAALENTDMLFISAGMGGGTGTGAAPVVARIAREKNILTVAIVTKPFRFEGRQRMRKADGGLDRLREYVDTLIVISNDRLLEMVGRKTTLVDAFAVINDVLAQSVRSIASLISRPGLINVDFSDIRTVMSLKGAAVLGVARAKGENRATEAIKKASSSPLLDKMAIDGAHGVLVCITGGPDLTLYETYEAMTVIEEAVDEDANVTFGAVIDETVGDEVHVTLIATGFGNEERVEEEPVRPTQPNPAASLRPAQPAAAKAAPHALGGSIPRTAAPVFKAAMSDSRPMLAEVEPAESAPSPAVSAAPAAEGFGDALKSRLKNMISASGSSMASSPDSTKPEHKPDLWAEAQRPINLQG